MTRAFFLCILSCSLSCLAQDRVELCRSDNATVYARAFRKEEAPSWDLYQVAIEVQNNSFGDLYYSQKARVGEVITSNPDDPILPPYVTVQVLNPAGPRETGPFYIHGAVTLHMSENSTQIFKVSMKRNEHNFKARIKKGEPPQLKCFFNEYLVPWDSVRLMPLIKKN